MKPLIAALIRHGIYEQPTGVPSGHLPHPLTAEGREQASALAGDLLAMCEENGWRLHPVLHTSTLLRAYETATIAAARLHEALGVEIRVVESEALVERSLGAAANLTLEEIERAVERDPRFASLPPAWKSHSAVKLPFQGCESLLEAGARVAGYLMQTFARIEGRVEEDTLVAFIGHGGAFRHAAAALGLFDAEKAGSVSMYHAKPVALRRSPENRWTHVAGEWKPRRSTTPVR